MIKAERGADIVRDRLDQSVILSVNLSEVAAKLCEDGMATATIEALLKSLPCPIIPFDAELALMAGLMRAPTRHLGLSLGDRACLALAARDGLTALTADRAWAEVPGITVDLVRG
jgi:PIN domain nuclease of toxin-antitoxin system